MTRTKKKLLTLLLGTTTLLLIHTLKPKHLQLASPFTEHMVLQQGNATPLWGTAKPHDTITIHLSRHPTTTTTANSKGHWKTTLPPLAAGGPYILTIKTQHQTIHYKDILIGQVLIAAGQSNMSFPLKKTLEFKETLPHFPHPHIRLLAPTHRISNHPIKRLKGHWTPATKKTASPFSAVALQTALTLHQHLNTPIGIIDISIPGSDIRAWMPAHTLAASAFYRKEEQQVIAWSGKPKHPTPTNILPLTKDKSNDPAYHADTPTGIYNAMLHPLIGINFCATLWYQGEDNINDNVLYPYMIQHMMRDWRKKWGSPQNNRPFLYVELPGYLHGGHHWPTLRLKQNDIETMTPHAIMVPANDLGAKNTIHPLKKKTLGQRMAHTLLATSFNIPLDIHGPKIQSIQRENTNIRIHFNEPIHAYTNPITKTIQGFYLANKDQKYHPAYVTADTNSVLLHHPDLPHPHTVSYNIKPLPLTSITDTNHLPARTFKKKLP